MTSKRTSEPITIVVDTREQRPWRFKASTITATVPTGADYSVQGFEAEIGIERKSLGDLVGSLTTGRARFMRSLAALATRRWRAVIVEAPLSAVLCGVYRSRVKPSAILGSIAAITADYAPVIFADDAGCAAALAERLLTKFADRAQRARAEATAAEQADANDIPDNHTNDPQEAA